MKMKTSTHVIGFQGVRGVVVATVELFRDIVDR